MPGTFVGPRLAMLSGGPSSLLMSLAAYWKLDGLTDSGPNGNTLTNNNAATFGADGVALNGTTQYLSRLDNASLSTGDINFTIAARFKLSAVTTFIGVMTKSDVDAVGGYEYGIFVNGATDDTASLIVGSGVAIQTLKASVFGALSASTVYTVIAWHDTNLDTLNIQVNGAAVQSAARTVTPADTNKPFRIGAAAATQYFLPGSVRWAAKWDRLLTVDERATLNAGVNPPF